MSERGALLHSRATAPGLDAPERCASPQSVAFLSLQLAFMLQCEVQQRVRAFEVELVGYVCAVTVYGADADEEFVGNLLAALVLRDQLQQAALGVGQR